MPEENTKVGSGLSITEKLKREVSLISHFVSDVLCYFANNPDGIFIPEFHFREQFFIGHRTDLPDSAAWFFDVLHPDDFPILQKNIRKVLHGVSAFAEIRMRDGQGEYRNVRVVSKPVWPNEQDGYVVGGIMALNLIEERSTIPAPPKRTTIIDTILSNYVILNSCGEVVSYSGAASKLLGQGAAGPIEGQGFFSFFANVPGKLEEFSGFESYHEIELKLKNENEPCVWILACFFPIDKVEADGLQNFVVLRDISDAKRAQQTIEESEDKFKALADNCPGVIFVISDGKLVYVNTRASDLIGYEATEMLEEDFNFPDIFHEASPSCFLSELEDELARTGGAQREVTVKRRDGKKCKCLISLQYMPLDGRKAILGIITDVSALHEAHEKLFETKERYWSLFEASSDAILIEASDGTILDCNAACEKVYGYSRAQLLGMNARDLVPADFLEKLEQLAVDVTEARASGRDVSIEGRGRRKDGSVFPTEVNVSFIKMSGEDCFAVIIRDISVRKNIEQSRKRYESQLSQLQSLDNLGQMASGLANDFNNLLTGIMGYSDLLLRDLPKSSASRDKAIRIIDAARKASEVINQLIFYTGQMPSIFQTATLELLIREMRSELFDLGGDRAIIKFEIAQDLPKLEFDQQMVKQALMNVVKNAVESIDQSGKNEIIIKTGLGEKDYSGTNPGYFGSPMPAGSYQFIKVTDSGCGILPENLKRIFEPFFSTRHASRGLGLSSVLGMVRGHRAAVNVTSEPGKGTEFSIFLPCKTFDAEIDSADPSDKSDYLGTVLVVDDEENVREILSVNFVELGYKAIFAEDGEKGLEVFRQDNHAISLIVVDLVMPGLSGQELIREIRWLNPEIPILVCSGCLTDSSRKELEASGVAGFIVKPFITRSDIEKVLLDIQLKVKGHI